MTLDRARGPSRVRFVACAAALTALIACGEDLAGTATITIYTSIYESVIAELDPILDRQFPNIHVQWYQRGSEDVAAKLNSEIAAGRINADLVMTSDPFWYEDLKEGGYLLAYQAPNVSQIPGGLSDPDHMFVTIRVPVMVLAANRNWLPAEQQPTSFQELGNPEWAGKITMGDPNRSGSMFTAVAALAAKYGWAYFEGLRENDVVAAGGNSSVLNRVATGEKQVGIILLENLLKATQENPDIPVDIIYPEDGCILVPSPIAILKATQAPGAAQQIYSFLLSHAGQRAFVRGWMYSPVEGVPSPVGARPWREVHDGALVAWSVPYLRDTRARREEIKRQFNRIMLE